MSDKYDISDLITNAVTQKPIEFTNAFNNVLVDKLNNAIEMRKAEIAQTMFNTDTDEEAEEQEDYQDSEEDIDD
jgi:hypothetical protein